MAGPYQLPSGTSQLKVRSSPNVLAACGLPVRGEPADGNGVSELNPKLSLGSSLALIVAQLCLLSCRITSLCRALLKSSARQAGLRMVEGQWGIPVAVRRVRACAMS